MFPHYSSSKRRLASPSGAEVILTEAGRGDLPPSPQQQQPHRQQQQTQPFGASAFGPTAPAGPASNADPIAPIPPGNGVFTAAPNGASATGLVPFSDATTNKLNTNSTGRDGSVGSAGATGNGLMPGFGFASNSGNANGNANASAHSSSSFQASLRSRVAELLLHADVLDALPPEQQAMAQRISETLRSDPPPAAGSSLGGRESSLAVVAADASSHPDASDSFPATTRDTGLPPSHPGSASKSKAASLSDRKSSVKKRAGSRNRASSRKRAKSIIQHCTGKEDMYLCPFDDQWYDLNEPCVWLPKNKDGTERKGMTPFEDLKKRSSKTDRIDGMVEERMAKKAAEKREQEEQRAEERRKKDRDRKAKSRAKERQAKVAASVDLAQREEKKSVPLRKQYAANDNGIHQDSAAINAELRIERSRIDTMTKLLGKMVTHQGVQQNQIATLSKTSEYLISQKESGN